MEENGQNRLGNRELITLTCLAMLVFIIHIWHVKEIGIFTVLDDEFGYWGIAAYFAGLDWSDAISEIPYYSYGYSLLLVPLFWIFDNAVLMYKAAIILNGILLSASFLLSYDIAKKLAKKTDHFLLMGIAFLISMYPAYIAYSKIAWAECLLIFIFWLLTWCFVDLNEQSRDHKFILVGTLSAFLFAIHQRTLGVLIACISVIAIMWLLKRIKFRQVVMVLIPTLILLIIHYHLKDNIQIYLWLNNEGNLTNDFAAQSPKIRQLMTLGGIISALKALIGQTFYICASSYLIAFVGLSNIIVNILEPIRNNIKRFNSKYYLYLFLFLAILMSLLISIVSKINPTRIDHIIYGRYIEMVLGPIILIGVLDLCNKKSSTRSAIINVSLFLALVISTYFIIEGSALNSINSLHAVGLVFMNTPYGIILPSLIAVLVYLLIYISFGNTIKLAVALMIIATLFLTTGEVTSKGILELNRKRIEIVKTVDLITESQTNYPIYFLWEGLNSPEFNKWDNRCVLDRLIVDCYQFLLKDQKIQLVNKEELGTHYEDKFVISAEINELFDLLDAYTYCITANESYLLVSNTSNYAINYNENSHKGIRLSMNVDNGNLISSGPQGDLLRSPYKYNKGKYEFTIDMELIGFTDNNLGYMEVYLLTDEVINVAIINATDFSNNKQILRVPFEVENDSEYIGIRVCSNLGTQVKFNDVHTLRTQN